MRLNVPLVPKDPDGPLRVLILGRISTPQQDLESIVASYRYVEQHLQQIYQGEMQIKHLGERASGMRTDRATIIEAEEEIESGSWDLVICEDLSRAHRNPRHQLAFVQNAVDAGTRVIGIGDNLDTADEHWEVALGTASLRHGLHIPDTRRRVRRTALHAFHRGGMVQKIRFGYRKLTAEEAASRSDGPAGLRIAKDPACTPIIHEMARRVVRGDSYASVADWLNDEGVAPGPYVTQERWSGRLVEELLRDPILRGTRTFGDWQSQMLYRTGKPKRRRNPGGAETAHYAELAHLDEAEHAALLGAMDARAAAYRHAVGRDHPLAEKPRSRVPWPAQHPRCAICKASLHRTGRDGLKCGNAPPAGSSCWCRMVVPQRAIRERVLAWVLGHCARVPGFRAALVDAAWAELQAQRARRSRVDQGRDEQIAELERRAGRLAEAISRGGELEALVARLSAVQEELETARQRRASEERPSATPGSRAEVDRRLEATIAELARSSYEFGGLMRRVLPVFEIVPVQALDSGLVRPRARLVLRPAASGEEPPAGDAAAERPGDVVGELDLFEPAAHIRAIPASLEARRVHPDRGLRQLAAETGINYMTLKRALAYARRMEEEGLAGPYRELTERPESASRWRHRAGA